MAQIDSQRQVAGDPMSATERSWPTPQPVSVLLWGGSDRLHKLFNTTLVTCRPIAIDRPAALIHRWQAEPGWVLIDLATAINSEGYGALDLLVAMGQVCPNRPLPVILLIAPGQERDALEAMRLGAADYLFTTDLSAEVLATKLNFPPGQTPPTPKVEPRDEPYRDLVEHSPDIVERFDCDLRHLYVSPVLTELTGIETEVFLGKTCRELGMDETMVNAWEAAAATVLDTGENQAIEFSTLTRLGMRHYEMAIAPECDGSGTITSLLCVSRDITARITAQHDHQQRLAAAQAAAQAATLAHNGLTSVFERINDGIIAFDCNARCLYLNRSAERIFGRSLVDLRGQLIWTAFPEVVDTPFYEVYNRAFAQQQPEFLQYYFPLLESWFEVRLYPDSDGITIYFTDISDRNAAEENRQNSERLRQELSLLERTLESILAGYWDIDFAAHTAYMSPGLKRMFGYADHELPNHPNTWQTLIFEEDLSIALDSLTRHIESRGAVPYYNEVRYRHKDGSTVWVICSGQVIDWDEAGQPQYMVGCHVNITQLKQTEAQLKRSEAHLREAQRISSLGSWEFDLATENITWSDQLYHILGRAPGYPPANFEALQDLVHPDDRDRHRQTVEALLANQQPYGREFRFMHSDGYVRHLQVKGEAVVNAAGEITHLTGTVFDLSDRKRSEAHLQSLSLRLSLALESACIGTWERHLSTDEITWDQCLIDLYGFARLGRPANYQDWRARVYSDDIDRVEAGHQALLDSDAPYDIEFRIWRGDGTLGWIRSSALVRRDGEGRPLSVIGINYDITETKQAEAHLLRTTAQLAASNRELEAFAYSVSHDLRAPLRAIDGFSRALVEDYGDQFDEEGRDYFDRIRHNVGRMGQLIEDLLRLSRVSRLPMTYASVNLSALVQEQIDSLRAADPDRTVVVTLCPDVVVNADLSLIQVAIANLVQNAWKFTAHRPTAHLEFGTLAEGEERVYCVKDDGAGFDMAYADKLFGVFQRLHNSDEFPGTGIGLATVQRVIHRHGGRVWARGGVDRGATFYFTLPPEPLSPEPLPPEPLP